MHIYVSWEERGWVEGSYSTSFRGKGEFRLGCEHLGRKTDGSSERSWTFCKEFGETSGKAQFLGAWEMGLDGMFFPAQSLEKSVDVIKIL